MGYKRKSLPDEYTPQERLAIGVYAMGDISARADAVAAYRRALARGVKLAACPLTRFMSEVDTPVPDLLLRARYRDECLVALGKRAGV